MNDSDRPMISEVDETAPLQGVRLIQAKIRTLPDSPGVYRMLDMRGDALYVGKAKSLRKRVPAYTKVNALS
ncbi:MAG: excinuclease ABC subunit UvrC, partial [Geminicoccaceae bacterium]